MAYIGVGYYRKTASPEALEATWTTALLFEKGIGTGVVKGDFSNGYGGRHTVTYYLPDGGNAGTFDLTIEKNGSAYRLTWRKDGVVVFTGLGVETTDGLAIGFTKAE